VSAKALWTRAVLGREHEKKEILLGDLVPTIAIVVDHRRRDRSARLVRRRVGARHRTSELVKEIDMHQGHEHGSMSPEMVRRHYVMLALNLVVSSVIMYAVMYTMIWSFGDFFNNLNTIYMVLMMVTPMGMLMLLMMGMMYPNKRLNLLLHALFTLLFIAGLWGMRAQVLVGDRQFIRSMIPHHSGAILMCNRSSIEDAEIKELCFGPDGIIVGQAREIDQMKAILDRL
jgi:hypothetical protein